MKPRRNNRFNMVEVTLALGVAVIGVVCIMALIPVALNASRDATADNYLPDVAQELATVLKLQCQTTGGWATLSNIPNAKPTVYNWDVDNIDRSNPYLGNAVESGGFVVPHYTSGELDGNFLIVQQTKLDDGDPTSVPPLAPVYNTDFAAAALVWQEDIPDFRFFNVPRASVTSVAKAIMVEVSWPATIPYQRRVDLGNVRTYRMEVFNPEAKL